MKITDVKVNRRRVKLHTPFKTALRTVTEIESIDVYIHTDEGVIGKGAAAATPVITGDFTSGMEEAILGTDAFMFNWSKYHSISAVTTAHSNELYWKFKCKSSGRYRFI